MVDGPGDRSTRRRHTLVATAVELCVATLLILLILGPTLADHGAIALALTLLTTLLARGAALAAGAGESPRGQALAPWLLPPLALIAAAPLVGEGTLPPFARLAPILAAAWSAALLVGAAAPELVKRRGGAPKRHLPARLAWIFATTSAASLLLMAGVALVRGGGALPSPTQLALALLGIPATVGLAALGGGLVGLTLGRDLLGTARTLDHNQEQPNVPIRVTRGDRIGELQALLERERLGLLDALARQAEVLARLGEANAAKIAEICAIDHEVRAALTPLLGHAELLERSGAPLRLDEREDLAAIRRLGGELLGELRRLLDMAMIEAGDLHLSLAPTDVDRLVDEAIADLTAIADDHGLTLVRRQGAALPRIRADSERLREALDALLANAIEFSDRGTITITTRLEDDARRLAIEVRDPGIGIASDELEVIFEAYRHRDRRPRGGRQRGVGLALARAIADGHGGELQVASIPGKGSVFTLTLPLEPPRRRTESELGELRRSSRRRHTPPGRAA